MSSENIRTPESKSVSLGVKRELDRRPGVVGGRRLQPRLQPVQQSRSQPARSGHRHASESELPAHHAVRDRRPRLVLGAADVARAARRRQVARVRRVVHARQGDSRRRRLPVPGAGSVESGGREVVGQQQPHAPGRRPHELAHARRASSWPASSSTAPVHRGTSPPAATATAIPSRTTGRISSIPRATGTIATPTTATSPTASATSGATPTSGPSFVTLDARLSKVFTVQRLRFEGFVEAFNATNKVNFASPQGTCGRRCSVPRRRFRGTSGRLSSASASISRAIGRIGDQRSVTDPRSPIHPTFRQYTPVQSMA